MNQDSWANGLPEAAKALRTLLKHVDSCSVSLWRDVPPGGSRSTGALQTAIFRYAHIFLPMYASYLSRKKVVVIPEPLKAALDELLSKATHKARQMYKKHMKSTGVSILLHEKLKTEKAKYARIVGKHGQYFAGIRPIPPLDVAFIWMLHRLSPAAYERDCIRLFGTVLPADSVSQTREANNSALEHVWIGNVEDSNCLAARVKWSCWARFCLRGYRRLKGLMLGTKFSSSAARCFLPTYLWPPRNSLAVIRPTLNRSSSKGRAWLVPSGRRHSRMTSSPLLPASERFVTMFPRSTTIVTLR